MLFGLELSDNRRISSSHAYRSLKQKACSTSCPWTTILVSINSLYTGGLFHCFILNEPIYHFRRVRSILSPVFCFECKILLANNVDPDQTPHNVASDHGLHCLPISVGHLTRKSGVLGSIPGLATYFRFSFRFFKKGSCQLLAKVCARSTG